MLLIIIHSRLLKEIGKIGHSITVRGVQPVSSKRSELTLSHLLGLLDLHGAQGHLIGVDSGGSCVHTKILRLVWGFHIRVIVVVSYWLWRGFGTRSSLLVLLGNA